MDVYLYKNVNKKNNSTKLPGNSYNKIDKTCVLKDNCSILNPILKFNYSFLTNISEYNYMYIEEFNRYYYVKDWVVENGLWVAYLTVDVLASFKTQIGNQSLYVLRSASDRNGYIVDTKYPMTLDTTNSTSTGSNTVSDVTMGSSLTNYFSKTFENGYYVVGIIGGNSSGVTYYSFTFSAFSTFMLHLSQFEPEDMEGLSAGVAKQLANPFQYITSCYWFPSDPGGLYETKTIKFGYYSISISGVSVLGNNSTTQGKYIHEYRYSISIPKHPQYKDGDINDWYLNINPYTERILVFNPFGAFKLDLSKIATGAPSAGISCTWYVDFTTGRADLYIQDGERQTLLGTTSSQFGVPIKLSQLMSDYVSLAKDTTKPITSAITGAITVAGLLALPAAGAAGTALVTAGMGAGLGSTVGAGAAIGALGGFALGGVDSFISRYLEKDPVVTSLGTQGSLLAFNSKQPTVYSFFHKIPSRDNVNVGRPLCDTRTINTLSGYIQCQEANITISGYEEENKLIANYLVGGFFYE